MKKKKSKTYKGSCLCGKVKFTLTAPLTKIFFCHCEMCRKNYGLYGAFIGAAKNSLPAASLKNVRWYASSKNVKRGFCKECGSPIMWKQKDSTHTFFLPGLIDGKLGTKKGQHIYVGDKGDYYAITDTLPRKK